MTCAHVLELIDAGPFVDSPRADAARRHARQCHTCGPALEASKALTSELAALPQPAPPPHLAAAVRARIASIEPRHATPEVRLRGVLRPGRSTRDWSILLTALGGFATGLATVMSMPSGALLPVDIAPFSLDWAHSSRVATLPTTTWVFVLAAGVVVYAIGLFAPPGDTDG